MLLQHETVLRAPQINLHHHHHHHRRRRRHLRHHEFNIFFLFFLMFIFSSYKKINRLHVFLRAYVIILMRAFTRWG